MSQYRNVRKINSKITGRVQREHHRCARGQGAGPRGRETWREFGELTGEMYSAAFRAAWLSAMFLPAVQFISAVALGAIVWYGRHGRRRIGGMTIGGIQAFITYMTFMLWPIQDLARVYARCSRRSPRRSASSR